MNHCQPLVKQHPSFDFQVLRVLILASTLDNLKAHFDKLDFLFTLASQCSKLEAILIQNSQNLIELPLTPPTYDASNLTSRILDLCGTSAALKILDLQGLRFLDQLLDKFA